MHIDKIRVEDYHNEAVDGDLKGAIEINNSFLNFLCRQKSIPEATPIALFGDDEKDIEVGIVNEDSLLQWKSVREINDSYIRVELEDFQNSAVPATTLVPAVPATTLALAVPATTLAPAVPTVDSTSTLLPANSTFDPSLEEIVAFDLTKVLEDFLRDNIIEVLLEEVDELCTELVLTTVLEDFFRDDVNEVLLKELKGDKKKKKKPVIKPSSGTVSTEQYIYVMFGEFILNIIFHHCTKINAHDT